jgi:hypothetical protein
METLHCITLIDVRKWLRVYGTEAVKLMVLNGACSIRYIPSPLWTKTNRLC